MAAAVKGAAATEAPPAKAGPPLVVQIGILLALTVSAAGMGWFSGGFLPAGKPSDAPATHGDDAKSAGGHGSEGARRSETIVALGPITTNVAAPGDVWVRMEVSIVLDEPQAADLPDIIRQDLLAYMRTVKMHEIEGASGFRHLQENLAERAAIRSDGHVKQVLIGTLLFE